MGFIKLVYYFWKKIEETGNVNDKFRLIRLLIRRNFLDFGQPLGRFSYCPYAGKERGCIVRKILLKYYRRSIDFGEKTEEQSGRKVLKN